jgi:hypothetical protein
MLPTCGKCGKPKVSWRRERDSLQRFAKLFAGNKEAGAEEGTRVREFSSEPWNQSHTPNSFIPFELQTFNKFNPFNLFDPVNRIPKKMDSKPPI